MNCPICDQEIEEEGLEDHFNWVHIAQRDYGDNEMGNLMMMMINGIIRPEVFVERVHEILDQAFPKQRGLPWRWLILGIGMGFGWGFIAGKHLSGYYQFIGLGLIFAMAAWTGYDTVQLMRQRKDRQRDEDRSPEHPEELPDQTLG